MTNRYPDADIARIMDGDPNNPGSASLPVDNDGFPIVAGSPRQPYEGTKIFSSHLSAALAKTDAAKPTTKGAPEMIGVANLAGRARTALGTIPAIAASHAAQAGNIQANQRLAGPERTRQVAETAGEGVNQMQAAIDGAKEQLQDAHAKAIAAAMPKLNPGAEMPARADVQMTMGGPGDAGLKMEKMARGGDDVAALVAGPYGKRALEAAGLTGRDLDTAHQRVVKAALGQAADDGNPGAIHAAHIEDLQDVADVYAPAVIRHFADDIRQRHGVSPLTTAT